MRAIDWLVGLSRYGAGAALAWVVYPALGALAYGVLLVIAIVTGQPTGGPLGLVGAVLLGAATGIAAVVAGVVAVLVGEAVVRRQTWPWMLGPLLAGAIGSSLAAAGAATLAVAGLLDAWQATTAWLVVTIVIAPAVAVIGAVAHSGGWLWAQVRRLSSSSVQEKSAKSRRPTAVNPYAS